MSKNDELREKLADYAHTSWSKWMEYLFEKSIINKNGTVTIPKSLVERWTRQHKTNYCDLPENERESDRQEADQIISIIVNHLI